MNKKVSLIYFSPTGSTETIVVKTGEFLSKEFSLYDLTLTNQSEVQFNDSDLVVIGMPVYKGRVPEIALENLSKFKGNQTPAISIVSYGNRDFDDSLIELNDFLSNNGYIILGSGAFIAEHSLNRDFGANRPDEGDIKDIEKFAKDLLHKLSANTSSLTSVSVSGNKPYKEITANAITPLTTDSCIKCGLCAKKCPTKAIPTDAPNETLLDKCILCMRCINICPEKARVLPPAYKEQITGYLSQVASTKRDNQVFI